MKKAIIVLALIAAVVTPNAVASAGHKTPPAPTPPPAPAHVCFYNGQQLPGMFYGECPKRYIFGV